MNDVDICQYDPADYHKHATAVFQNFSKYNTTVRENVGFGRVEALSRRSAVETAVHLAQADTVVEALPDGLQTILESPGFESLSYPGMLQPLSSHHHGLSGGEVSRVTDCFFCSHMSLFISPTVAAHCLGTSFHES